MKQGARVEKKKRPHTWIIIESTSGSGIIGSINENDVSIVTRSDLTDHPELRFGPQDKVCISCETVLDDVLKRLDNPEKHRIIESLKDKSRFRDMLKPIFPDFFYQKVHLKDMDKLILESGKRYCIKPIKGYWGSAAHIIDENTDLKKLKKRIEKELGKNISFFSDKVLSKNEMILEQYLEGEEYAVDMYFSEDGTPVILNICHHPIPPKREYLHVVYYTGKKVFDELYDQLFKFLKKVNVALKAKSFPVHAEFKLTPSGLIPVEFNPLRFGSDGFADLGYHAYGNNPFLCFARDIRPDWKTIQKSREGKFYAFYLGYNGTAIDTLEYRPNARQFRRLFSNIITDTALNYRNSPAFSVVYFEENSLDKIYELLRVEFNQLFVPLSGYSETTYRELNSAGLEIHLKKGAVLWKTGELGDYLLLVLKGELEVYLTSGGKEKILDCIGPGSIAGELSALDGLPRSACVRTKSDCVAVKIMGPVFRKLLNRIPDILEDLFWQQVNRVRNLNREIAG